ncbi:uncharacterized protein LOC126781272 [Nymphalis io]|uniref:uncharacterized protein LOC126781272 n=1 Tax=Inachis io TaxID=171585 RepID=UPI00216A3BD2|nr:uncharacterized protein LOC126781272 [Nymphalis io]
MNGDVEGEAPRLRPLSGGIWTFFSWLRRSERSFSDESINSVGSDRTVASFDFLAPFHYKNVNPLILPQRPLTDTYKKRLHERNLQRQYDRDLTLRRKYGLYTEEGLGYDAFSLPPARKIPKDSIQNRQRRAISESTIQPRAAYVPGKRRAPLPPTVVNSTSLPRYYKRKRPAPKPPLKLTEHNKENVEIKEKIQMSSKSIFDKHSCDSDNKITELKTVKNTKKDHSSKEVKLRSEKSFLKHIFDSKKRNSAIDTNYIKVLPSISELDKQAAEIIQTKKLLNAGIEFQTEGAWICTNCLRKYDATIISCIYCVKGNAYERNKVDLKVTTTASNMCTQTDHNAFKSNKKNEVEDKKQLKKMLKEMKDSLPKKSKNCEGNIVETKHTILAATETPTLRIGSIRDDKSSAQDKLNVENYFEKESERRLKIQSAKDMFLTSQPGSSKQMPPISKYIESNVKAMKMKLHNDINNSSKDGVQTLSSSSSSDENIKKQLLNNEKIPLLKKSIKHEREKEANNETRLNLNGLQPRLPDKNKILSSADRLITKSAFEIELSSSTEERKIASKENPTGQPTHKIKNLKIALHNTEKTNSLLEKKQLNNDVRFIKNKVTTENSKNIEDSEKIAPKPELKIKPEITTNKKNENFHLVVENLHNQVQKMESNTNALLTNNNLHTPLKISSLLNPFYCPKYNSPDENSKVSEIDDVKKLVVKQIKISENENNISSPNISKLPSASSSSTNDLKNDVSTTREKKATTIEESKQEVVKPTLNTISTATTSSNNIDHHAQRRDLINQLEQSIAKGDEQTAAAAAAKLAKLKLSCSVLSFSSQIVGGPLTPNKKELCKGSVIDKKLLQPHENLETTMKTEVKTSISTQESSKFTNDIVVTENKSAGVIADEPVSSTSRQMHDEILPIDVWIEDKDATRGPIRLLVTRKAVLGELKRQAEKSLGLQIGLQRWIIGKTLCSNDSTPLIALAGPDLIAPFYLCLVESETNKDKIYVTKNEIDKNNDIIEAKNIDSSDVYKELMKLEQQALVPNSEEFECGVCIEQCAIEEGVVLRECIHTFCRECLADVVRHCTEPVVSCPAIACLGTLQEREIRALLSPEDYEKWLARSLAAAESGTRNTFHCRTRDCTGWAFCEPEVRRFPCPVCNHTNCIPCQAVHDGETCDQYQIKLRAAVTAVETDQTDVGTQALLKSLIDRGEALECPECKAVITKKWGCDWIKCSACKTEICWVTKGRRWGPGGKGDTTGGCRCGIDGKRCHPSCGYCH